MPNITIIGGGFAALTAVRRLRKKLPQSRITLIAPQPDFIYLPSLIWIPAGLRRGNDLRIPLSPVLRRLGVEFLQATVQSLDEGGRRVTTDRGEVRNDALLIASGGRFIKKLPGIEHALTLCEGIEAAEAIRTRLTAMHGGTIALGFGGNPQEPAAMRGGPMFELLFGLDTMLRRQGRRERFELVFFSPAPQPGKRLGEKAVSGLLREMKRRGIDTHLGHKLVRFEGDKLVTEGGEVPADLILFMPGLTGPAWLADSGLPLSPGGFVKADVHCQVAGPERVYVAGDSGSFPGPDWLPKQAHMADLQAATAVDNLVAALNGQEAAAAFRPELICIVDTLDKGMLIYRDSRRAVMLPGVRLLHWLKRFFEWWYLRPLRQGR